MTSVTAECQNQINIGKYNHSKTVHEPYIVSICMMSPLGGIRVMNQSPIYLRIVLGLQPVIWGRKHHASVSEVYGAIELVLKML